MLSCSRPKRVLLAIVLAQSACAFACGNETSATTDASQEDSFAADTFPPRSDTSDGGSGDLGPDGCACATPAGCGCVDLRTGACYPIGAELTVSCTTCYCHGDPGGLGWSCTLNPCLDAAPATCNQADGAACPLSWTCFGADFPACDCHCLSPDGGLGAACRELGSSCDGGTDSDLGE
jgi:hypothetical protein